MITTRLILASVLSIFFSALAVASTASEPYPTHQTSYEAIEADIAQARETAIKDETLLLLALGGNWCHDSVGFVEKTQDTKVAALFDDRYTVQLVNVGYLEFIREIVQHYNVPVIYGTPTVLVIEPNSNSVLNRDTLSYWRSADARSIDDTLEYFGAFAPGQMPETEQVGVALSAAYKRIDAFEQEQAERLYEAYSDLGRQMAATGDNKPSDDFIEKWTNVGAMRSSITTDLANLRASAREQDEQGVAPIELSFPSYTLYTD
ncbi:hypothetical protein EY643_11755 [Halioglobus maricola]|uniref:Thioredoxin family protein n=1 Tax=Halioglobus maricola TaxID=2601894 RepID=A0A5P9NKB3_9GAMM|nr:hypothetical protein [Halioglobus maricola]QFU76280.1 hypothetical protein EY643_11755 [Halioglobus maricola]